LADEAWEKKEGITGYILTPSSTIRHPEAACTYKREIFCLPEESRCSRAAWQRRAGQEGPAVTALTDSYEKRPQMNEA